MTINTQNLRALSQAKLRVSAPRRSQLIGSTLAALAVRDLLYAAAAKWSVVFAALDAAKIRSDGCWGHQPGSGQRTFSRLSR
jgi:hypothetical protein